MALRRTYLDGCAAAHALDLVGDRWALLIVRELLLGPKRFTDLRRGLLAVSPNVLTQRLSDLEAAGVVLKQKLPPPASVRVYALTEWGSELETIVLQLARWGVQSPAFKRGASLGTDALLLSFKAMFHPSTDVAFDGAIELEVEGEIFHLAISEGELQVARGEAPQAYARITTDAQTVLAIAYGKRDIDAAVKSGTVTYTGEKDCIERFLAQFALPPVAGTVA